MAAFPTTRWTLIRQAAEDASPEARQALASLCEQYAGAVLAFVRHRVSSQEQAEDIAQGFFAQLIERDLLGRADADRGRFRTFLRHALRGYMADVHDFETAQKRGGGKRVISLATSAVLEPLHGATPEQQFDIQWVRTLLQHALMRLEEEYKKTRKHDLFRALKVFLDSGTGPAVRDVASELRMSESAVRVALHRMRRRLGQIIRTEIAETVPTAADVDDELRRLMQIVETRA